MSVPHAPGTQPQPQPPHPRSRQHDAFPTVLAAIAEILPSVSAHEVTARRTLADLGADSVDRVEILTLIADRLGRREPLSALANLPDIGALVAHLNAESGR